MAFLEVLESEKDRWRLWLPVGLGIGIEIYFGLMLEPSPWIAAISTFLAILAIIIGRRWPWLRVVGTAALLLACGLGIAQWHTHNVAAPKLAKQIYARTIEGRVAQVWAMPRGPRLLLGELSIVNVQPSQTPKLVRVTTRQSRGVLVGDRVRLRASVRPPSWPALPGSFDFERKEFFENIGGYGFALGPVEVVASKGKGPFADLGLGLNRLRQVTGSRIQAASSPGSAAVAQALMTGDRSSIVAADLEVMRDSGLAHLLAISGLHMGLMAAIFFFVIRALLALVPALALRYPIKKYAAFGSMVGALAYLALTGATVPTQRAFVMTCLVLLAVILHRRVISMALVAWAALAVLVISPQSLLGPSLQLSFAAVIALIAVYEALQERFRQWRTHANFIRRVLVYVTSVGLTTVVAGLATAPFAIYHFNRFAIFGLMANLIAVLVMAMWVMPCVYLLMMVGLESVALAPMGWGIELILSVARAVASLPGSVALVPSFTIWGLTLIAIGGL